ncbi:MAG TPA: UvrB/UvrC motif-containing protein [Candidatus Paceibacterota bacterium]|nr:UvrB/UvrC motif-containing protein [Candidatus Paceibacterota bacterium]
MVREDLASYDLPDEPGVYVFRNAKRQILYIGRATSLKSRVRSYFAPDLIESRGPRIVAMVEAARHLTWETTDSVLEAIILEANLIKKHQPPYNVDEKDNKSWNYVVITKEAFPRVLLVRGRSLFGEWDEKDIKHLFGPFPQGSTLKEALKIVRSIFPYRDRCTPCTEQKAHAAGRPCKPCFDRQLGLCPGVCSGEVSEKEYATTIRHIAALFSGKKKTLLAELGRDMKRAARQERFEEAAKIRGQIAALTHIRDVALIKNTSRVSNGGAGIRIEGYDIAHTAGTDTVGIMVVIHDGEVSRGDVRKFRVRTVTNNDPAALAEIVSRRLDHPEWPLPRLFVIDGSKAQVGAVERVLEKAGVGIPVVGVVKDEKHRPRGFIGESAIISSHQREILLADDEAHKRAIGYHHYRQRARIAPGTRTRKRDA